MKKWLKFFGVTVTSAAASAVMTSIIAHPEDLGNLKTMGNKAAAGAIVAALTLIINNPLTRRVNGEVDAEMKRSAQSAEKTKGDK